MLYLPSQGWQGLVQHLPLPAFFRCLFISLRVSEASRILLALQTAIDHSSIPLASSGAVRE